MQMTTFGGVLKILSAAGETSVIIIKTHLDIHSNTRENQVSCLQNLHPQFAVSSCTAAINWTADAEFGNSLISTLSLPAGLLNVS